MPITDPISYVFREYTGSNLRWGSSVKEDIFEFTRKRAHDVVCVLVVLSDNDKASNQALVEAYKKAKTKYGIKGGDPSDLSDKKDGILKILHREEKTAINKLWQDKEETGFRQPVDVIYEENNELMIMHTDNILKYTYMNPEYV